MSQCPLVLESCAREAKDGGLAQVLQRRTPAWGDRAETADYHADPRWRSQPATVKRPENSTFRRSRKWAQRKRPENSTFRRSRKWAQRNDQRALPIAG